MVDDGYLETELSERHKLTLELADAFLAAGGPPSPEIRARLQVEFTDPELVELTLALALFHGFSKMLIVLGLEPEQMDTMVMPTPALR